MSDHDHESPNFEKRGAMALKIGAAVTGFFVGVEGLCYGATTFLMESGPTTVETTTSSFAATLLGNVALGVAIAGCYYLMAGQGDEGENWKGDGGSKVPVGPKLPSGPGGIREEVPFRPDPAHQYSLVA